MPRVAKVVEPPKAEPVSLERARRHLRLLPYGEPPEHFEDAWIIDTLPQCRQWCETYTDRSLAPQVLEIALDHFLPFVALRRGPVLGVDSVKFDGADGEELTVPGSTYFLDDYREPALLALCRGQRWPLARRSFNAVRVRYRAGYAAPGDAGGGGEEVPGPIVAAILLLLGHFYENREGVVAATSRAAVVELPMGVESLLLPYRVSVGV